MSEKASYITCGIDPGLHGAIALTKGSRDIVHIWDMPTRVVRTAERTRKEIHAFELHGILKHIRDEYDCPVWMEDVHSMPRDGHVGAFKFGMVKGALLALTEALCLDTHMITPAAWKRRLSVPADKERAMALASLSFRCDDEWWPLKKHDGRAEAALLALYGFTHGDVDVKDVVTKVPRRPKYKAA